MPRVSKDKAWKPGILDEVSSSTCRYLPDTHNDGNGRSRRGARGGGGYIQFHRSMKLTDANTLARYHILNRGQLSSCQGTEHVAAPIVAVLPS